MKSPKTNPKKKGQAVRYSLIPPNLRAMPLIDQPINTALQTQTVPADNPKAYPAGWNGHQMHRRLAIINTTTESEANREKDNPVVSIS